MENSSKNKPHFHMTLDGARDSTNYLRSLDKMKDFWIHPSTTDIIDYANKLWNERE